MRKKIFFWLSMSTLIIGALIAVYVLLDRYILNLNAVSGSCTLITNRPLIYIAIVLCASSFLFSLLEKKSNLS